MSINITPVPDVQGAIATNLKSTFWYDPSQSNLTHTVVFVTSNTGTFSVGTGTQVNTIVDFWYTIGADNASIEFKYCTKSNTWNKNFYVNVKYPTIASANLIKTTTIQMSASPDYEFLRNGVVWDPLYSMTFGESPLPNGINDVAFADRKEFYGVMQTSVRNLTT